MSKSKWKRKGCAKFLMLEGYLIRSAAWQHCTPNDKAIYLELKWRYDGLNNGRIGFGCREAGESIGVSKDTAQRSLDSLEAKGFIVKKRASGFNMKSRLATEWLLTEYGCNVSRELPRKDFMRWQPEKSTVAFQGRTVAPQGQLTPERRLKCA